MKFGVLNKSTTVNRFVLHTLQRNITHLAIITPKTNIKLGILKGGNWKRAHRFIIFRFYASSAYCTSFLTPKFNFSHLNFSSFWILNAQFPSPNFNH